MSNNSDYNKRRTDLFKLLPERLQTNFNRSLFENTFNRFLTKTDLTHVTGAIGEKTSNQIVENTPHRQAFQIQPLAHAQIATVDHLMSFKEFLNELSKLGVDISRFDKWATTETFNFAPPIDVDKLINYVEYYWYDPTTPNPQPEYITIRSICNVFSAQATQKAAEIEQLTDMPILSVNVNNNSFNVANDLTFAFLPGAPFNVKSSDTNTQVFFVLSSTFNELTNETTIQTTTSPNASVELGVISLDIQLETLKKIALVYCEDTIGWDTFLWDDNTEFDGTALATYTSAFLTRMDASPGTFSEYIGIQDPFLFSLLVNSNYLSLEHKYLWDKYKTDFSENPWSRDNKWFHKLDLTPTQIASAFQAKMPIIEYAHTLHLNKWNQTVYEWKYRDNVSQDWTVTENKPTVHDIYQNISVDRTIKSDFHDKWLYVGVKNTTPHSQPAIDETRVVLSTASNSYETKLVRQPGSQTRFDFPDVSGYVVPPVVSRQRHILADSNDLTVYLDGTQQYGNFREIIEIDQDVSYVIGIEFDEAPSSGPNAFVEVILGASVSSDMYMENVPVRTIESNVIFSTEGPEHVTLMEYRVQEQTKQKGEIKYPLFDIFNVDGTPALISSPIFKFKENASYAVNPYIGKRIEVSNRNYVFEQTILDDSGKMYFFKDINSIAVENPEGLQSVWRKCDNDYVPTVVDGERNIALTEDVPARYDFVDGDWEIPSQWINNPGHENKKIITYTQLVSHFLSIAKNQPIPSTFFSNYERATRLQPNINYGVGGTIKEHNKSFDLLMSAVFSTVNNPLDVIDFANKQYDYSINTIKTLTKSNVIDALLNTSDEYMQHFYSSFAANIISQYENNDWFDQLYGDSTNYNTTTGQGIQGWIATLPSVRIKKSQEPAILRDDKLGIFSLIHHDGHVTEIHIDQTTDKQIKEQLIETIVAPSRIRGWRTGVPADGITNVTINTFSDIPYARLLKNDYWLADDNTLYQFNVVSIQQAAPHTLYDEGSFWLRSSDGQLFVLQGGTWVTVGAPEITTPAWKNIDLEQLLAEVLLEVEQRLYDVTKDLDLMWSEEDYLLPDSPAPSVDVNDEELKQQYELLMFLSYAKENEITTPFQGDYDVSNAFTWNYKGVDVTSDSIEFPAVTKDLTLWGARWYTTYENVFNTSVPHLEPWKMQGYTQKPTWWDLEYNTVPGRRWSSTMWSNIKSGVVPSGYDLPGGTIPQYQFVCVNTTDNTTSDGYGPDDLLPPYWTPASPADAYLANEVFIRSYSFIQSATTPISAPYVFGDNGPYERRWRESSSYRYDQAKIGFLMQPISFMHKNWGVDFIDVAGLNISTATQNVLKHSEMAFHGDVVNNNAVLFNGINQWYVNMNRFNAVDEKTSDFHEMWTLWEPKLSYQVDYFIDPKSLDVRTDTFTVEGNNRRVIVKKTRGIKDVQIDALRVTVAQYGQNPRIKNNIRVPRGPGNDWVFTIDSASSKSREIEYYGSKEYDFTVHDKNNGILKTTDGSSLAFENGDIVSLYTTDLLPSPLAEDQVYYFISIPSQPDKFKLAESEDDAIAGINIVLESLGTTTQGVHRIHRYSRSFYAMDADNTDEVWYHNEVDKTNIQTQFFPFQITGVQNVINFVNGYAEFSRDQGFVFNHNSVQELDSATNRVVSWELEIERFVDSVYHGIGINNNTNTYQNRMYQFTVDEINNYVTLKSPSSVFDDGDEVYIYTNGAPPQGLLLNKPYYMIRINTELGIYRLASNYQNALDGIPMLISSSGSGTLHLASRERVLYDTEEYVEINPFRSNIWLQTPTGIVSDVIRGPFEEIKLSNTLYDQYGRVLDEDNVQVYREDTLTRVYVYPNTNDMIPSYNQTPYNSLHMAGWHAYIDEYEHVILFDNYLSDNTLIYDPFLGMYTKLFKVDFDRQTPYVKRPSVGGFTLHGNDLIRNIEGSAEDLHAFYSVYDSRESEDYLAYARDLLGYKEPKYLDMLGVSDKSKFVFWRGAIQQKGSLNSVDALMKSKHFLETNLDEYWAYKVASFGNRKIRDYPAIHMRESDVIKDDIRYNFDSVEREQYREKLFNQINFEDTTRWQNLPDVKRNQPKDFYTIKFETTVASIQNVAVDLNTTPRLNEFVLLDYHCDKISIYSDDTPPVPQVENVDYKVITNKLVQFLKSGNFTIFNEIPAKQKHSPLTLFDTMSKVAVDRPFLWDPARGYHYHKPMQYIDIVSRENPVRNYLQETLTAGKKISFEFVTSVGSANVTLPGGTSVDQTIVLVNGRPVVRGVDFNVTNNTVVWTVGSVPTNNTPPDQITVIIVKGTTATAILKHGSDIVGGLLDVSPTSYIPSSNNMLLIANGSVLVINEDYIETNSTTIQLLSQYQSNDEFICISMNTIMDAQTFTGDQVVGTTLDVNLDNDETANDYVVLVNGTFMTPGVDFNGTPTGIEFIADYDWANDDSIIVIGNKFVTLQTSEAQQWDDNFIGTIWWNTNALGYKFYHDDTFYGGTDEQLTHWGTLADWANIELLEWTRSSVPPEEYDELARVQEGNTSIDINNRAAGVAKKFVAYKDSIVEDSELYIEFYRAQVNDFQAFKNDFDNRKKEIFSDDADVIVYVNNIASKWMKFSSFDLDNYTATDFIRIVRFYNTVKYPSIEIDVGGDKTSTDITGLGCTDETVYTLQIILNSVTYYVTVLNACTYGDLIEKINITLPTELRAGLNDAGNILLETLNADANTTLQIKNDNLFRFLTGFVSIGDQTLFEQNVEEYADHFSEVYDYLKILRTNDIGTYYDYYFWVKDKSIAQFNRKMSLKNMTTLLQKPDTSYFVLKNLREFNVSLTTGGDVTGHTHYSHLTDAEVNSLTNRVVSQVVKTSSTNENHTHTLTFTYNNGQFNVNVDTNHTVEPHSVVVGDVMGSRYLHLIVRGVRDIIHSDERFTLIIPQDDTLRDYSSYANNSDRKNQHEEWKLFRKNSGRKIEEFLWNKLTDAAVGFVAEEFANGSEVPVPSFDRVQADITNGTNTRFGLRAGQTFGEKEQIIQTIQEIILRPDISVEPLNKVEFIERYPLDTPENILAAMNFLYASVSADVINTIFFECMYDTLTKQPEFFEVIKTSYISVHNKQPLQVPGA